MRSWGIITPFTFKSDFKSRSCSEGACLINVSISSKGNFVCGFTPGTGPVDNYSISLIKQKKVLIRVPFLNNILLHDHLRTLYKVQYERGFRFYFIKGVLIPCMY